MGATSEQTMGRELKRGQLVEAWSFLPQAFLARLHSSHPQELLQAALSTKAASLVFMCSLTYFLLIFSSYPAWIYFIDLIFFSVSFPSYTVNPLRSFFFLEKKILKKYVFTYFVHVGMQA